jgi:3-oxoacyl-[acyl-carrier-protein] synthase II
MNIAVTNFSLVGPGYEPDYLGSGAVSGQNLYQKKLINIFKNSSFELLSTSSIGHKAIITSPIKIKTSEINEEVLPRFVKIGEIAFLALGDIDRLRQERTGYIISSSKGGLDILSDAVFEPRIWHDNPYLFNYCHTDGLLNYLRDKYDLSGPMKANVNACSTGLDAIIQGCRWLEDGVCDRVVVGVSETNLIDVILAGFNNMGVVASDISVPFSKSRSGFVPSEGAAFVVLEKVSDKEASRYPLIAGRGQVNDAYHPTSFSAENYNIAQAMKQALTSAHLDISDIRFVKAHGTATELNDKIEAENIYKVFGNIPVSSYKSVMGHLLGTSGLFEFALMLLLFDNDQNPVTIGLNEG